MLYITASTELPCPIKKQDNRKAISSDNLPIEFRRVSEQVFGNWVGHAYQISHLVYAQFMFEGARLYGYLYYINTLEQGWTMSYNRKKGVMEYFLFGCHHDHKELTKEECDKRLIKHLGNMWHVLECQKCKHILSFSSD